MLSLSIVILCDFTTMIKKTIIWLRNDLRLSDNAALSYACTNNSNILFLYILDESYVIGAASKWFLYKSLNSLCQCVCS